MRSSVPLYDALAEDYEAHFAVVHRRAYDQLAWEVVEELLPAAPGCVVDAGCGIGRWADAFLARGHQVIGIEQAPRMLAEATRRLPGSRCRLIAGRMEQVDLPPGLADLVIAMGSLQYTADPGAVLERFARWLKPGGAVAVLVDSLVAMGVQKLRAGKVDEALRELSTRRGTWSQRGASADLHLLDGATLAACFREAGLVDVRRAGLLVSASTLGLDVVIERLITDWDAQMALERRLRAEPVLADLGKQLLVWGRLEVGSPVATQ